MIYECRCINRTGRLRRRLQRQRNVAMERGERIKAMVIKQRDRRDTCARVGARLRTCVKNILKIEVGAHGARLRTSTLAKKAIHLQDLYTSSYLYAVHINEHIWYSRTCSLSPSSLLSLSSTSQQQCLILPRIETQRQPRMRRNFLRRRRTLLS